jgi:hypothetical protein
VDEYQPPDCVTPATPKRKSSLKPLRGVPSESGFYGYSGIPLSNQDKANLEAKGVDFTPGEEGDLMPGGPTEQQGMCWVRLKHPQFRKNWAINRRVNNLRPRTRRRAMTPDEFEKHWEKWMEEYRALPDPKPKVYDWFVQNKDEFFLKELLRNALLTGREGQSVKAIQVALEYGKSKPKQTVGIETEPSTESDWDADKIIEYGLQLKGLGLTAKELEAIASQKKA